MFLYDLANFAEKQEESEKKRWGRTVAIGTVGGVGGAMGGGLGVTLGQKIMKKN